MTPIIITIDVVIPGKEYALLKEYLSLHGIKVIALDAATKALLNKAREFKESDLSKEVER